MYTVYILQDTTGKLNKGMTSNLNKRILDHKYGGTKTTAKFSDIKVVYTEEYGTVETARNREKYLKTAAGRRFIKKLPL